MKTNSSFETETSANGRYVKIQKLSTSTQTDVYIAYDTSTGKEVEWHYYIPNVIDIHQTINSLTKLNHPNIFSVKESWEEDKSQAICFITEINTSQTLKQLLYRTPNIDLEIIQSYCSQILDALNYLHSLSPPFYVPSINLTCENIIVKGSQCSIRLDDVELLLSPQTDRNEINNIRAFITCVSEILNIINTPAAENSQLHRFVKTCSAVSVAQILEQYPFLSFENHKKLVKTSSQYIVERITQLKNGIILSNSKNLNIQVESAEKEKAVVLIILLFKPIDSRIGRTTTIRFDFYFDTDTYDSIARQITNLLKLEDNNDTNLISSYLEQQIKSNGIKAI